MTGSTYRTNTQCWVGSKLSCDGNKDGHVRWSIWNIEGIWARNKVNCGPDGAPNSFTNFKNSALAVGAALASAAATPAASTTAAYGDLTIPAAPVPTPVTQVITLAASTWTTTYNSYPNSPAPTPGSLEGNVHRVIVGGPSGNIFEPSRITALPRDIVVFEL